MNGKAKAFLDRWPHLLPSLVACTMLLAALWEWPYGYYRFLRWVVCAAAVFTAWWAFTEEKVWATWLFGFVAVLFNPVLPIHLTRPIWQVVDVGTAAVFLVLAAVLRRPADQDRKAKTEPEEGSDD